MARSRKLFFKSRSLKNSIKTLSRWAIALALLPSLWATLKKTALLFPILAQDDYKTWWFFVFGAVTFLFIQKVIHKPLWFYVFAHELTHAISGLLSGARIHSFKATSKGGEVRLSKSNAFVALSPYIVPFYTVLAIVIYALIQRWWPHPLQTPLFQFFIGMTLAFHWFFTWEAVHTHQPDLKILGLFLSGVLILLGNVLILGLLGVTLFKSTPSLKIYTQGIGRETAFIWKKGIHSVKKEIQKSWTP